MAYNHLIIDLIKNEEKFQQFQLFKLEISPTKNICSMQREREGETKSDRIDH